MAELTTKQRNSLPKADFALAKERKYVVNDRSHAANAKARAQQQFDKGDLSMADLKKVDAKADRVLRKAGYED